MPDFGEYERRVLGYFAKGTEVLFENSKMVVKESGKPTCSQGEPKTDIYVLLEDNDQTVEVKISYKKENADFLENKTNALRAEQLFGSDWRNIIKKSTTSIQDNKINYKED